MATRHSTGSRPAFVQSIRPSVVRGQLYFQVAGVLFPTFAQAATAWSAAECHRLDLADLVAQRTEALADMRRSARNVDAFAKAAKREATLALQIRQLRAGGGGMNLAHEIAEARASALSLRASAKACGPEHGALKFRLVRAAESLDGMVGADSNRYCGRRRKSKHSGR